MKTEHIKLYTETDIIIKGLKRKLEDENIDSMIKDRFESARLGGYGENSASVELYVKKKDLVNAENILTLYKEKINA